jgi:hypothetical protein
VFQGKRKDPINTIFEIFIVKTVIGFILRDTAMQIPSVSSSNQVQICLISFDIHIHGEFHIAKQLRHFKKITLK